jgi:hypothetical protein
VKTATSSDAQRLARIRAAIGTLDGDEWLLTAAGGAMSIDARGRDGSLVTIATIDGKAGADELELLAGALDHVRFLLGLVDRCAGKVRALQGAGPERGGTPPVGGAQARSEKNFAAEASMKCQEPAFMAFLHECHGLDRPLSPEKAARKLRSLCGVTSRKDLNDDAVAAGRWKKLRDEFEAWRRAGR